MVDIAPVRSRTIFAHGYHQLSFNLASGETASGLVKSGHAETILVAVGVVGGVDKGDELIGHISEHHPEVRRHVVRIGRVPDTRKELKALARYAAEQGLPAVDLLCHDDHARRVLKASRRHLRSLPEFSPAVLNISSALQLVGNEIHERVRQLMSPEDELARKLYDMRIQWLEELPLGPEAVAAASYSLSVLGLKGVAERLMRSKLSF